MTRDYKRRPGRRKKKVAQPPGWIWMLFGLGVGLSVAMWVYLYDRQAEPPTQQPVASTQQEPASAKAEQETRKEPTRFSFYEVLPKFEVVIPETESSAQADTHPVPITEPGQYVLQAGSFKNFADADRMQATLGLLGLEARVQKVSIDSDTWHRVRLGPYSDLDLLNRNRELLRRNQIEVIRIRVGD
ncbi:MAG: SPOR domain-containing protein [Proteobacteria bacterium]|nr:SPOR domain-containing protein [Pseudomonadota bacterium]